MSPQEDISVETMVRKRRAVLLGFAVSWGLWQTTRIVGDFTDGGRHLGPLVRAYSGVYALSWLAWMVCLVRFLRFGRKLKARPALVAVMWDELFEQTRFKAATIALGCIAASQVVIIVACQIWPLTALEGADITILVAVTSFVGAVLWMDRE